MILYGGGSARETIEYGWKFTYYTACMDTLEVLMDTENTVAELEAELETLKLDQSRFLGA